MCYKAVKALVLMLGQRQAEEESEKLIRIWRDTGTLSNLTCCRPRPGVLLFQVLSFPTSPEALCKSQIFSTRGKKSTSDGVKCEQMPVPAASVV